MTKNMKQVTHHAKIASSKCIANSFTLILHRYGKNMGEHNKVHVWGLICSLVRECRKGYKTPNRKREVPTVSLGLIPIQMKFSALSSRHQWWCSSVIRRKPSDQTQQQTQSGKSPSLNLHLHYFPAITHECQKSRVCSKAPGQAPGLGRALQALPISCACPADALHEIKV